MLLGVCAGCRREEDARSGADALQLQEESPQKQRNIATEEPAVFVHLVDDHEPEPLKKGRPLVPPSEERHVEILGIRQQYLWRPLAHGIAVLLGSVAVVRPRLDADRCAQLPQLLPLIERERLHGVNHEGVGTPVPHNGVEHRDGKSESLAAGSRRLHDDIKPAQGPADGFDLMRVGSGDVDCLKCAVQGRMYALKFRGSFL